MMREGALALTCLSCVIGARVSACLRITDDERMSARTSTGPGARSSSRTTKVLVYFPIVAGRVNGSR